jgi:hypothetical protein
VAFSLRSKPGWLLWVLDNEQGLGKGSVKHDPSKAKKVFLRQGDLF